MSTRNHPLFHMLMYFGVLLNKFTYFTYLLTVRKFSKFEDMFVNLVNSRIWVINTDKYARIV